RTSLPLTSAAAATAARPLTLPIVFGRRLKLSGRVGGTAMNIMNPSRLPRHTRPGYRFASALTLGLALIVTGAPGPGRLGRTVSAQTLNPCELTTVDEIRSLSGN